jgi:hypothetical protein
VPRRPGLLILIFSPAVDFIVTSSKKEGIITRFFELILSKGYFSEEELLTRNEENPFLSRAVTARPKISTRRFVIRVFV